ncbi:MFS transporter [Mobilitalea sibirica]|uniref:MFS transporter n=1 Tax=Mobilitalea sibirica TaxID=1462919 RepID=A0A8J7GZY8_9FIRM|nr:MFS transporter [Mobilitalea sibirica]MBH1939330.1 MFS transporter [Mobilitalea sibirica]
MLYNIMFIHRYLMGQVRRIYFMALPETKKDYKKSRVYYTTADSAAQTIVQLAGGTFLASIMSYSGISDANIGIITSLVSFAALSQLFLINFLKRIKKYKLLVCVTALQRTLFALIYLIPLLGISNMQKSILIVVLYFIGQVFVQIGLPASQDWIASLVPCRLRGKYFSIKDSVAVFVVSSTMLLAGMILDYYKPRDILVGFVIIGTIIFILTMVNVIALSKMKEPKTSYVNQDGKEMHGSLAKKARDSEKSLHKTEQGILMELKGAFIDRKFRKAFTVQCLFTLGFYICIPFNASYQINELALPYTFIMLIGFVANLYRIYITPKFGRLADKFGMAKMLRYTLFALGLNFLTMALTVPENAYPLHIIGSVLASTAWAFVGIGLFGVQLDFFKSEKRMVWLTITSSVSGIFGFLVSIVGGAILSFLQRNPIELYGRPIYAQQVLNILGFFVLLSAVFYIRYYIETEKIDTNRSDGRIQI